MAEGLRIEGALAAVYKTARILESLFRSGISAPRTAGHIRGVGEDEDRQERLNEV